MMRTRVVQRTGRLPRPSRMRHGLLCLGLLLALTSCGTEEGGSGVVDSGVQGLVHLGPQCPVEIEGQPCDDQPAAGVVVTVHEQVAGESYTTGPEVARGTTDADGNFRIAVPPGEYVVTAQAGMYCELMDARVTDSAWTEVDVPCDTGIR